MGRHSVPDEASDDAAVEAGAVTTTLDLGSRHGRHARRDEREARDSHAQDLQATQMITIIDSGAAAEQLTAEIIPLELPTTVLPSLPEVEADGEPAPVPSEPATRARRWRRTRKPGTESDTQADLRLLREHPAVRAQVLAAVVVSFALYTVVMFVIGKASDYVLWIWIPIVISGVGIGLVLDAAHRRARRPAADSSPPEPPSSEPPAPEPSPPEPPPPEPT